MKKKLIVVDLIIILLATLSSYIASDNIFIALVILAIYGLYFFIFFNRFYVKYENNTSRYHECFHFINDYTIALSNYESLLGAFEAIQDNFSLSLKKEIEGVENVDILEKIKYLQSYFPFHMYYLFTQIIEIYDRQGGNILDMTTYLTKQSRSLEEHIDAAKKYRNTKILELSLLWGACILILIFIRFGLAQFFETLKGEPIFIICIVIFYLFLLMFIHIALNILFKIDIRRFAKYEKN